MDSGVEGMETGAIEGSDSVFGISLIFHDHFSRLPDRGRLSFR